MHEANAFPVTQAPLLEALKLCCMHLHGTVGGVEQWHVWVVVVLLLALLAERLLTRTL